MHPGHNHNQIKNYHLNQNMLACFIYSFALGVIASNEKVVLFNDYLLGALNVTKKLILHFEFYEILGIFKSSKQY